MIISKPRKAIQGFVYVLQYESLVVYNILSIDIQDLLSTYLHNPFFQINSFRNKPWFLRVCSTSVLKTPGGKEEIARTEQFLLFPQCFLPI